MVTEIDRTLELPRPNWVCSFDDLRRRTVLFTQALIQYPENRQPEIVTVGILQSRRSLVASGG